MHILSAGTVFYSGNIPMTHGMPFGCGYILPKPFDHRPTDVISPAVAAAANQVD